MHRNVLSHPADAKTRTKSGKTCSSRSWRTSSVSLCHDTPKEGKMSVSWHQNSGIVRFRVTIHVKHGFQVYRDTTLVNYSYLSDGTKLSALDGSGEDLVYRGAFVYRKSSGGNAGSSLTLESSRQQPCRKAWPSGTPTPARKPRPRTSAPATQTSEQGSTARPSAVGWPLIPFQRSITAFRLMLSVTTIRWILWIRMVECPF